MSQTLREDWDEAPETEHLFGREQDIEKLKNWILSDYCHLICLLGMGGIGKTFLATKLAKQTAKEFEMVVWRSLRNAPPLTKILKDCIHFLSHQQDIDIPENIEECITRFINYLALSRSLIVLDNIEAILLEGKAGEYRDGYEDYGRLFNRVAEEKHQSCIIITGREKPREIGLQEGDFALVRSYQVNGLTPSQGKLMLMNKGLIGSDESWAMLVSRYSGNPLALRVVAEMIREVYFGIIDDFLAEGEIIFGRINDVIGEQFNRLSRLEQSIMLWLAIGREPISRDGLWENLVGFDRKRELMVVLESLRRRSLIEKSEPGFTLQNVVMEFVSDYFIDTICKEFKTGALNLLYTHPIIQAQTKEYVRESQIRILLKPLAERLLSILSVKDIENALKNILLKLRQSTSQSPGYAAGNILNLLLYLKCDLRGYDFSHLYVWEACLQKADLKDVNFSCADLRKSVFTENFGGILTVAFSPNEEFIAAGTTNSEVRVWRVSDQKQLFIHTGHTDWVDSIAYSYDGKLIASGSHDQSIRLWNSETGECLEISAAHKYRVRSVAFSLNENILASGGGDTTVRLWDALTGQCIREFNGHTDWIEVVAFSPNGTLLASGSADHTVRLWDVKTGQCVQILQGHGHWVRAVAFTPDNNSLASGSYDQTIKIWDVKTGNCLNSLRGHISNVISLTINPDSAVMASGSSDHTIRLWDTNTWECYKTLQVHNDAVYAVIFNPGGTLLASGSRDYTLRLWDVRTGQCIKTFMGETNPISAVAFDPTGKILASGSHDYTIRLWDIATNQCLRTLLGHSGPVVSTIFYSTKNMLASGSHDHTIKLWDTSTGHCVKTLRGHSDWVWSIDIDADDNLLASGSIDQTVRLWDIRTGKCIRSLIGNTSRVISIAFNPNGSLLASGTADHNVRIWDIDTGKCLKVLYGHTDLVRSVAFSPDGKTLSSGSVDQSVRLWDAKTGECIKVLKGHKDAVMAVSYSSKGNLIASGSADHSIYLWDVNTGEHIKIFTGHNSAVWSVVFSPDDNLLASSSQDETIRLWSVEKGCCVEVLRPERLYERMNITGITGLTDAQKITLKALGATEYLDERKTETPPVKNVKRSKMTHETFSQGYAVVIGVGADLPVTIDDATAIGNILCDSHRCAYPSSQVKLLVGPTANRASVLSSLDWLADVAGEDSTAVVYFSGHGIETPDYYLMPYGYNLANLAESAISDQIFTEKLRAIKSKKLVVFLDCCHAGGQADAKEFQGVKSPFPLTTAVELNRSSGRVILASSHKDEVSWTGKPYSIFTAAVLEALAGYGSFEQDSYARVLDLALWVGRKVPERTQDKQHPIIKISHLEDNFALAWYAAGQKSPSALPWTIQQLPSVTPGLDTGQLTSWQRMIVNYREHLLLIEERMSEYVEFTVIPLQLVSEKRRTENAILELERKLGLRG